MLTILKDPTLTTVIRTTIGETVSTRTLGAVSILIKEAPVGTAESYDDSNSRVVVAVVVVARFKSINMWPHVRQTTC